ncbi:hypothetical protein MJM28_29615, partial [Salmonella enterica subsp. enterica serovar Montevideo]|nr:hypothetical protein [Salmonella enterica subsp. enterica serovar Montevideo]
ENGLTREALQKLLPAGAARNAVDSALWDLQARQRQQSLAGLLAEAGIRATLVSQRSIEVDAVIAATGLRPETALARRAGVAVNRG